MRRHSQGNRRRISPAVVTDVENGNVERKMAFLAERERGDTRDLFIVQNPHLRAMVMPLFTYDAERASERPNGYGTAFR